MKWNQPIVMGLDAVGLEHIEQTGSEILKQKWHCETDLTGFFDSLDENDFPQSPELWASIISGNNYAKKTEHLKYSFRYGNFLVRPPGVLMPIVKWLEHISYQNSESPLLVPVFRLNSLRSRKDFIEGLWKDFRLKKSQTVFNNAHQANVVRLITYNDIYEEGLKTRKLMGDYLNASGQYRKQRNVVVNSIYSQNEIDGNEISKSQIIRNIDNTPTNLLRRGKLKRLKIRRKYIREELENRLSDIYDDSEQKFLENLNNYENTDKPIIDFGYFSNIDTLLHLFNEKELTHLLFEKARNLYNEISEIAEAQDRPIIVVSDHGMKMYPNRLSFDHSTKGFFFR